MTLSIPKMPLPWMKYKLFFQHFNEKLQIRLNTNLFGSFESHLHNKHKIAFQWAKIIMIILSVHNVLIIYLYTYQYIKFNLNSSSHTFTAWMLGENPWGKHNIGRSPPHWENERHFVLRHRMGCW